MTNNHVLRRLRYIFDLSDQMMVNVFAEADLKVKKARVADWMRKDDDLEMAELSDLVLATFLNGLINHKRGKRDGPQPKPEKLLTNNLILRKLRIALNFKEEDMMEMFDLAEIEISKHELSAFFRNPSQKQYRLCHNQFLRHFLLGLQFKLRPKEKPPED